MTRNGRKIIAIVLGLLFLQPVICAATSSRLLSLGGDADYIEDDRNVLRWFGSLSDYGDLVIVELGDVQDGAASAGPDAVNQGAGIHYAFDRPGITWGLYLSDVDAPGRSPGQIALLMSKAWARQQIGLFFSHFSRTVWESEPARQSVQQNVADATIGLGLRSDIGQRFYVDVAGEWIRTDREYLILASQFDEEADSWRSFAWRARGFYGLDDRIALVPVVEHRKRDHLTFSGALNDIADRDMRATGIGLGANILPDGDNLLVASFTFRWEKEDLCGRGSAWEVVPRSEHWRRGTILRLAWESRIASWLTLRAGARQVSLEEETRLTAGNQATDDVRSRLVKDPELDLTFGLALHVGAFAADFVFNDDAPFSFGHFLTGAGQEETHTFTTITLSYTF